MKAVKISNLHKYVGCKIMRNVYIGDGIVYLNSGSILSEAYIRILQSKRKRLPFEYVYVDTPDSQEVECYQEVLSDQLKFKVRKKITQIFNNVSINKPEEIKDVVEKIIEELYANRHVGFGVNTLIFAGGQDHATHCFNVAVLSSIMAVKSGLSVNIARDIALGAAIHDIGKARINRKLIDMRYRYSSKEDFLSMQRHPIEGYNLVKNLNISAIAKKIILLHHVWNKHEESFNKKLDIYQSYPMEISGRQVEPALKNIHTEIVQVADVFEAMTNQDRIYKTRKSKAHALEYIRSMEEAQFGEGARLFLTYIAPYSTGTEVFLNNGDKAIIVKQSSIPERPVIKFLSGSRKGQVVSMTDRVNLTLFIVDEV